MSNARYHAVGDVNVVAIQFQDGTVQTTAATGGGGGVTTVSPVTDPATDDKGAVITGTAISMEKADATHYGVVKGTFSGTSTGTNTGDQTITLTGDVTGSGTGSFAATIANSAVTNAKMANMADQTFKGNVSGGSAAPSDLSVSQVKTALAIPGEICWFGSGIDGDVTITTTVTLTQDKYYHNLTISGAGQLITAGWRVHVSGTLDLSGAGAEAIISVSTAARTGANGNLNTGGSGASGLNDLSSLAGATTGGGGASGSNGAVGTTGTQGSVSGNTNGGNQTKPGAGGAGTAGAGGGQAGTTANTRWNLGYFTNLICKQASVTSFTIIRGGAAGSGGGSGAGTATGPSFGGGGGGGGASGAIVWIAANIIATGSSTQAGIISVKGGNGGNGANGGTPGTNTSTGGGGGGSGGSGGMLYLAYAARTGSTVTNGIDLSGGTGGTGGNGVNNGTGTAARGGGGGGSGGSGEAHVFNLGAGTATYTATVNGTDGTAQSSTTTGVAGQTNTQRINL